MKRLRSFVVGLLAFLIAAAAPIQSVQSFGLGHLGARGGLGSLGVVGKRAGLSAAQIFALQKATLTRVKATRTAASANNPVDNADYPTPPTLVQSATHNAALTVRANHLANPTAFQLSGGRVYDRTTTNELFVAGESLLPSTSGNLTAYTSLSPALSSNGEFQNYYSATAMVTGQIVEVQVRTALASTPYRLIVDNQYIGRTAGFDASTSSKNYNSWDFGSTATRRITVEVQTANAFVGFSTSAGGSIVNPNDTLLYLAATGDSLTENTSTGDAVLSVWDGWPVIFAKKWGFAVPRITAVGGTGWVNIGTGRTNILGQLATWINEKKYDIIFCYGGYNDTGSNLAAIQAAMLPALQAMRAAQPQALIVVGGVWGQATGPSAAVLLTEANVKSVFQTWNDPFSIFLPNSNDPGGSWLTGTGFVGSTTGVGNADTMVSSDGTHWSQAGRIYSGGKVSTAMDAAMPALYTAYGVP